MADNMYSFTVQTVEISTGTPETVCNDATRRNPLGALMKWNGNLYRYVRFDDGTGNVAAAAAGVSHWKSLVPTADLPLFTVTSDQSPDAMAGVNSVAGILKGVVTDQNYTFIGVGGIHNATCSAASSAGMKVIGSATDLTFALVNAGTACVDTHYGSVLTTSATTTSSILLHNLVW